MKIIIVPILFFWIVTAIWNSNTKVTNKVTRRTILLFAIMFLVAFLINFWLVALIWPGNWFHFTEVNWDWAITTLSIKDWVLSIIPDNIINAMSTNAILPTILFSFALWFALKKVNKQNLNQLFNWLNEVFNLILKWIIYLTPIWVFFLMWNTVATYWNVVPTAFAYVWMAWLWCIIVCLLVMILPVWIYCKINPIQYIKKISEIWIITLSTCSSAATLPETIRVCNEKLWIPKEVTNIVVPLWCTIHMCWWAVSFSLLALFTMQMFWVPLTLPLFFIMIFSALIINMWAPWIPWWWIVIWATYLSLLWLPLTFIWFYAWIYRLLDMAYTSMNVTWDITANCLITKSLKLKDEENKLE